MTMGSEVGAAAPLYEQGSLRLSRCRHGYMLYLHRDQYIGRSLDRYGEYAEAEIALLTQLIRPGNVVIDAGANIGTHTVVFSRAVGRSGKVIAFEPQRYLYHLLCANVALNDLRNVQTILGAAGEQAGVIHIPSVDYDREHNFGGVGLSPSAGGGGEEVPVRTIDSLRLNACHLIKIDVEGMEAEVLQGASTTVSRFRPALYIENDRPHKSPELIRRVFSLGYRLYWHISPLFSEQNFKDQPENVFGGTVSICMLGLPASAPQTIHLPEIHSPDEDWRKSRNSPPNAIPR